MSAALLVAVMMAAHPLAAATRAAGAAQLLAVYRSEAADRVAVRFITDEDGRALYRDLQRQWQ